MKIQPGQEYHLIWHANTFPLPHHVITSYSIHYTKLYEIVLLAEDDPKIAKLIISLLGKDGCQVDHAHDGEEALLYRNNFV